MRTFIIILLTMLSFNATALDLTLRFSVEKEPGLFRAHKTQPNYLTGSVKLAGCSDAQKHVSLCGYVRHSSAIDADDESVGDNFAGLELVLTLN